MFPAITSDRQGLPLHTTCRQSLLVHKTTTCGNVHTILLSFLDLPISLTITSSNTCYISMYFRPTLYFNSLTLLCLYFSYVHVSRFVGRLLNQDWDWDWDSDKLIFILSLERNGPAFSWHDMSDFSTMVLVLARTGNLQDPHCRLVNKGEDIVRWR